MTNDLVAYGFNETLKETALAKSLIPARVLVEHQDRYTVITPQCKKDVFIEGKTRHQMDKNHSRPVVGDWIGLGKTELIQCIFPRTSFLRRKKPGQSQISQVLAANITRVYILVSCNRDFTIHRLERFLLSAHDATPNVHVVLTKTDLVNDMDSYLQAIKEITPSTTQVHPVSLTKNLGTESLLNSLKPTDTSVLLGSSGVGKSTLGNLLLGSNYFPTAPIRVKDDKGRHTSTRRELIKLPANKGLLIDTPGLRDLSFWISLESLARAFPDIDELAFQCKFRNCSHVLEKQCAIQKSYSRPERLASYFRLRSELSTKRNN